MPETVPARPGTRAGAERTAQIAIEDARDWCQDALDAARTRNLPSALYALDATLEHAREAHRQLIELLVWKDV
jgi:hypothetical protein